MLIVSRRVCVIYLYKNFTSSNPVFITGCLVPCLFLYYCKCIFYLWARFKFDQTLKYADNTNNFDQSFNHVILNFRGKPIFTMSEVIRKLVGGRFVKRFKKTQSWEVKVVHYVEKKLNLIECSSIIHAGRVELDVTKGETNFTIKLSDTFCDLQRW
ncbi:hypothetical protein Cgig2_016441 [Carnegiea gigantea]|uniref:Uncharacterized protein n=1 Tax=Carnegiea gigantea TaxID=171969 RepID=A0A9Q1K654_9CARY|nr:hypothetical protein Cgig2_016441 [Carnegiea gigantea]